MNEITRLVSSYFKKKEADKMSAKEKIEIVQQFVEYFNQGNIENCCALHHPDAIIHGGLGNRGIAWAKEYWHKMRAAFPNMKLIIDDIISEGETVVVRFTENSGPFEHPFMGIEPTGKEYSIKTIEWFKIVDGKIKERWSARDSWEILQQLGTAPL